MKRALVGVIVVGALAAAAYFAWNPTPDLPHDEAKLIDPPRGSEPVPPSVPTPPESEFVRATDILRQGDKGAIRSLAAEWRRTARGDPAFLLKLVGLVLDESADRGLREIAAFVLGSIPEPKGLEALAKALDGARDPLWMRSLLLALGCDRAAGEDDDIFDLPDSPRVLGTPAGLSVRIRGAIESADLRSRLIPHVRTGDAGVRWSAALALADSTGFAEVRAAFLESIRMDRDAVVQGEAAKALAEWAARESADSADRLRIFTAIFEEADRTDAAALRLRSEEGMKRMPWTPAEVRLMAGRIEAGSPDQKRWAIAVLSGAASQPSLPDRAVILDAIAKAATAPEAKVREYAVAGLGSFAGERRATELLVASLHDAAWHVRAAGVRALARMEKTPEVQAALLRAEREDPDERIRRAAGEVRKRP